LAIASAFLAHVMPRRSTPRFLTLERAVGLEQANEPGADGAEPGECDAKRFGHSRAPVENGRAL
jgi:hypothetical protein